MNPSGGTLETSDTLHNAKQTAPLFSFCLRGADACGLPTALDRHVFAMSRTCGWGTLDDCTVSFVDID